MLPTIQPSFTNPTAFIESALTMDQPPEGLSNALQALWWDANGNTMRALQTVENENGLNTVWVRAYLRRKMGDETTASYWYAKAIRPVAHGSFPSERGQILGVLLQAGIVAQRT